MKLSVKKYLKWWLTFIVFVLLFVVLGRLGVFMPHHVLAKNPHNIEAIVNLDLPDVASVESWDNLDRSSSKWDCYEYEIVFSTPLSESCTGELDRLCEDGSKFWSKVWDGYRYYDAAWDVGGNYCVQCTIRKDSASVEYYVDEAEGELIVYSGVAIAFLGIFLLTAWGIVLLIKGIFRWFVNR